MATYYYHTHNSVQTVYARSLPRSLPRSLHFHVVQRADQISFVCCSRDSLFRNIRKHVVSNIFISFVTASSCRIDVEGIVKFYKYRLLLLQKTSWILLKV